MTHNTTIVYMTAGTLDEARTIGAALVESKLAACVNILGTIESIYTWKGKTQNDGEVAFIAKTSRDRVADLTRKVSQLHSYECPCIVSIAIDDGHPPFLKWIVDAVEQA